MILSLLRSFPYPKNEIKTMKKHNKCSHIQHIHTHHIVKTQNWSHNIQAKDEQDEKCPNKVI